MKKTLVSLFLVATFILSMSITILAVDDVGPYIIGKDPKIVKPLVDDVGPY